MEGERETSGFLACSGLPDDCSVLDPLVVTLPFRGGKSLPGSSTTWLCKPAMQRRILYTLYFQDFAKHPAHKYSKFHKRPRLLSTVKAIEELPSIASNGC